MANGLETLPLLLQSLLYFNHSKLYPRLLLKSLPILFRDFILLLDVYTAEPIEQLILLIPFLDIDNQTSLNKSRGTRHIEFNPPEKQTSRLLFLSTLKLF